MFSSVAQSCLTLCNPMDSSKPGFPVYHQLPELTQTHVHSISNAIQPSHPLSSSSPSAFNLSQHQGLSQWVSSSHQVAKVLESWAWLSDCAWAQMYKCQSCPLSSSHPLLPPLCPHVCSLGLHLFFCPANTFISYCFPRFHIYAFIYILFLSLTCFALCDILEVHHITANDSI